MKKWFLLLLILINSICYAQMGVAKIKYEEAEEAYSAKKYAICLEKLNETVEILKATNPRVQYLKIMCLSKIIESDPLGNFKYLMKFKEYSNKYLIEYDNISDLEEKYRAVYNVAEMYKKFPNNELEYQEVITLRKRGRIYQYDKDSINYQKSESLLKEAINRGDIRSKIDLANIYITGGYGVVQNISKANELFQSLSDSEFPEGQFYIGTSYLFGMNGYNKDVTKGVNLVLEAAKKNYLPAIIQYGIIEFCSFQINKGQNNITADYMSKRRAAVENWLTKAEAEGGTSSELYYYLGKAYSIGAVASGVNTIKALEYFKKSASLGNVKGINALGYYYMRGWGGLTPNNDQAYNYFKIAADKFFAAAEYNLSTLFSGYGGYPKDKKQQKYWYDRYSVNPIKCIDEVLTNTTYEIY